MKRNIKDGRNKKLMSDLVLKIKTERHPYEFIFLPSSIFLFHDYSSCSFAVFFSGDVISKLIDYTRFSGKDIFKIDSLNCSVSFFSWNSWLYRCYLLCNRNFVIHNFINTFFYKTLISLHQLLEIKGLSSLIQHDIFTRDRIFQDEWKPFPFSICKKS